MSLRDFDRIADRIRQHRQVDKRPVAIGEGPSDRRFVDRVLPRGSVSFFEAGTRSEVLNTAQEVAAMGVDRVAGVVDRDFDDVVAELEQGGSPVVTYDDADLEAMLWWSRALDDVLEEIGSETKLRSFGGPAAVRSVVAEIARPIQRLRRANALHGWGLPFDSLDLRQRMKVSSLEMSIQSLCDALWDPDAGIERAELYAAAEGFEECQCPATGRALIRGRDALAVTGVLLRRAIGSLSHQQAHPDRLSEALRLRATEATVGGTAWRQKVTAMLGV
jgi:hypothetical protein